MKWISSHFNPFKINLFHFFGWVFPKKKVSKIVNTFCHRGGSSDPVPNQGGVRLIKKKSSTNVPEGGGGTIYLSFSTAFSVSYPKMCIVECLIVQIWIVFFQGGGLWQKIKFLNAISIDLRVGGLGTFPYLNKFFKGFL